MHTEQKQKRALRKVKAIRLTDALDLMELLKGKVEQCAIELSSVNASIKQHLTAPVPGYSVARALIESAAVERKVFQCAEDLAALNAAISDGVVDRKALELELSVSRADLSESEAELSHSQAAEQTARHLAYHDAVTGLPNRILFNDRLTHALAQAERHGWRAVIMFIDLDKFKRINDSYGHDIGDEVLHTIGQRLQASVRAGDTVSRRGGDEFLYLMLEAKDDVTIEKLALKIRETIAEPFEVENISLTLKASIGIAIYPEDALSAEELLKNADMAMYRAKQSKKGHLLFNQLTQARWRPQIIVGSVRSEYLDAPQQQD
jgi:diguanylate cyclase (GGDEF)-like protein